VIATLAWCALAMAHATGYFLLADDHALVAEAANQTLANIFGTSLFGVYRPLGFLLVRLAGWLVSSHGGWSAVTLLLHAGNAALLTLLAIRSGYPPIAAGLAGTLFLWSPWGSEAYLWFSGLFDVGAAFGVLLATLALTLGTGSPVRSALAVGLAVLGCLLAAGFKENGYLAAGLVPVIALSGFRQVSFTRAAVAGLLASVCVAGVLVYRTSLLAPGTTPYGLSEFGARLLSIGAVAPAASNVRGLLLWPVPAVWADTSRLLAALFIWPIGATMTASVAILALAGRARAWLLVAALCLSLAPTAFFQIDVETITPRRYLYLAGIPLCLLVGSAVASRLRRETNEQPAMGMVVGVAGVLLAAGMAGAAHVTLWKRVTTTARCAMDDFGRQIDGAAPQPVYVENMPFAVNHGPFILLDYDFRYVYPQRPAAADVVFRQTVLTLGPDGGLVVEGHGDVPQDAAGRMPIALDLCLGPRQ
jgi:hypothetical protein